jgi:phosphoribosylformylglycinamidine synthase PurS subunit
MEFSAIEDVRAGKFFRLTVRAANADDALAAASRACERLLANPVIETFDIALDGEQ